jgi:hypothetical protein
MAEGGDLANELNNIHAKHRAGGDILPNNTVFETFPLKTPGEKSAGHAAIQQAKREWTNNPPPDHDLVHALAVNKSGKFSLQVKVNPDGKNVMMGTNYTWLENMTYDEAIKTVSAPGDDMSDSDKEQLVILKAAKAAWDDYQRKWLGIYKWFNKPPTISISR